MGMSLTRTTSSPLEVIDEVTKAIESVVEERKEGKEIGYVFDVCEHIYRVSRSSSDWCSIRVERICLHDS
jgi:hypothetical protein